MITCNCEYDPELDLRHRKNCDVGRRFDNDCVFCRIVCGKEKAEMVMQWSDAIAFVPLRPVTKGHTLIIPVQHVADFAEDPNVSGAVMRRAAQLMHWNQRSANIITSRGREATQSVFHLHLHLIPRAEGDRLALPWYSGKRSKKERGHG